MSRLRTMLRLWPAYCYSVVDLPDSENYIGKMNIEEYKKITNRIAKGPNNPGYYLYGDEEFIKQGLITAVKNVTVNPDFADFNVDEFWGGELRDTKPLFDALLSIPMMADYRIVILREAHKFKKTSQHKAMIDFDVPQGCVFLVDSNPKTKTNAFHKGLVKRLEAYECSIRNDTEMIEWVEYMASKRGLKITRPVIKYLVERSGENLETLAAELDKLFLSTGGDAPKKSDIDRMTAMSRSANIFQLADSFVKRDFKTTLALSKRLFDFGESGVMLIAFLKGAVMNLLKIKSGPKCNARIRVPGWKMKLYKSCASNWTTAQLHESIKTLARVDIGIKTGKLTEREAITQAIVSASVVDD